MKNNDFNFYYSLLKEYFSKNNEMMPSYDTIFKNFELGKLTYEFKIIYTYGRYLDDGSIKYGNQVLTKEQIDKLNKISFVWDLPIGKTLKAVDENYPEFDKAIIPYGFDYRHKELYKILLEIIYNKENLNSIWSYSTEESLMNYSYYKECEDELVRTFNIINSSVTDNEKYARLLDSIIAIDATTALAITENLENIIASSNKMTIFERLELLESVFNDNKKNKGIL